MKEPGPIEVMLERVTEGIDSISAKLLLREAYEQLYLIFDHNQLHKVRPLGLVAMHPKENVSDYSKLYRTVFRYKHQNIKEHFGLSLTEFLDLPHEMVELCFKIAYEHVQKETPAINAALKDLERSNK